MRGVAASKRVGTDEARVEPCSVVSVSERNGRTALAPHAYTLCGWHTKSDIPLTGVSQLELAGPASDVRICLESQAPSVLATDTVFRHAEGRSLISVANVATFEVLAGQRIRVWPNSGAAQKDIEIFLFGQVWATLCHQRKTIPLHASAVLTASGIIAFVGHSGAGKSTMAAKMIGMGYALATDDILPITFRGVAGPGAWPYLRRLKLKEDVVAELSLSPTTRVGETLDNEKSFVLPNNAAPDKWQKLARIYVLDDRSVSTPTAIERLQGADAIGALIEHTYHYEFIRGTRRFAEHLAACATIAAKVPIYRLEGSQKMSQKPTERAGAVVAHMSQVSARPSSGVRRRQRPQHQGVER